MTKTTLFLILPALLLLGCSGGQDKPEETGVNAPQEQNAQAKFAEVKAVFETEPVDATLEDDAADDPAFWINHASPESSLIFGSDKKKGLDVFDFKGRRIKTYDVGRINNVDVRQSVLGGLDIVAGSNRSTNATDVWRIEGASGELIYLGAISSKLPDVYGFCLYHNRLEDKLYAFINSKTGKVEQWELSIDGNEVSAQLVRVLELERQVEGMVADDHSNDLYVGVEEAGVYRFDADANASVQGRRIPMTGKENDQIRFDVEGLAILRTKDVPGYLIVSSQGNNSYAIFDRTDDHQYLGSFQVVDGELDGAQETDGIEAVAGNFGTAFPEGVFICQDGYNYDGDLKKPQNFKLVSWKAIRTAMKIELD